MGSYAIVRNSGFIGDDIFRIVGNPDLNSLSDSISGSLADRPVLMFSIWLDHFFGLNKFAMMVVSIFFHSLVSFQLFQFILERSREKKNENLAFGIALLFSLHPLHSQSINIIIQRGVILASLFGILSMRHYFLFLINEKKSSLSLSILFFILALLTKPIVFFLPLFYLIASIHLKKEKKTLIPFFLSLSIPVIFYFVLGINSQANGSEPPLTYFAIQAEVLFTYFRLMIFPYGLKYLYDVTISSYYWVFIIGHLAVIAVGLKFLRSRIVSILFCGFYLSFIPESSFFSIIHPAFEHRTYFPLIFLFSMLGVLAVDSKYSRMLFKILPAVGVLYICLIQVRNLEIDSVNKWKKHTVRHSMNYHNFNLGFNFDLMREGDFTDSERNIELYEKRFPGDVRYQILKTFFEIKTNRGNQAELIERLGKLVVQPYEGEITRNSANRVLAEYYTRPGSNLQDHLKLELILSKQMHVFFGDEYLSYRSGTLHYQSLVNGMLRFQGLSSSTSKENILKMKVILYFYFGQKFPGLKEEVEAEFAANPQSRTMASLKKMVER